MAGRGIKEMVLLADGISCAACAKDMEDILRKTEGILDAIVSYKDEKIKIIYDNEIVNRKDVLLAVRKLGYSIKILSEY